MVNRAYNVALFLVALLSGGQAISQDETYIRAGRLVNVVDGRMLTNQTIVVRADRIERVGSASSIDIPAGSNVISATRQSCPVSSTCTCT
jgi:hypothetical protein